MIVFLLVGASNYCRKLQKIYIYVPVIGKYHKCLKTNLVHFVLAQFHSKKAMSQPPCFDIEYWRSHRPFLSNKSQWSKIQNIYCNFFNFQYNNIPLQWVSIASSTGHSNYSYGIIYELQPVYLSCQVWPLSFNFFGIAFLKVFGSNMVPVAYSWMYQLFSFFPVVSYDTTDQEPRNNEFVVCVCRHEK